MALRLRVACALAVALGALATGCARSSGASADDAGTLFLNTARIRGFDPIKVNDLASGKCVMRVYECLLQHSYLERPFKLEPLLTEAMPEISPDGLVYTFRLRKGIRFVDDACFTNTAGKGRELVAEDFVYSLKRIADQKNASVAWWILDGKVAGLDAFRKRSAGSEPTDYDAPVSGLQAVDRYTLRITLTQPYPQLVWVLAMHHCVAVPREAVVFYGDQLNVHPVGTGAYVLKEWQRNYRLEFVRSPVWRATGRVDRYPSKGGPGDEGAGRLVDAGRELPLCDRIVCYVIGDPATEWLTFLSGGLDEIQAISRDNWNQVVDEKRQLLPDLAARGFQLFSGAAMAVGYIGFNMDDPVVGKNLKLRQAMSCAFNHDEWLKLNNYRIKKPTGPIPEGVPGYPEEPLPFDFDLTRAKQLLAEAGYPEGKDPASGRRLELTIEVGNADSPETRQSIELFVSFMEKIGVQIQTSYNNWPTFLQKLEHRQVQIYYLAWTADYPDAQNFLLLFSGEGVSPGPNHSNYVNPAFDELYQQALVMADTPERTALYRRMAEIVRQDCPWIFHADRMDFVLRQPWTANYKFHPLAMGLEKYHRVDGAARAEALARKGGR